MNEYDQYISQARQERAEVILIGLRAMGHNLGRAVAWVKHPHIASHRGLRTSH